MRRKSRRKVIGAVQAWIGGIVNDGRSATEPFLKHLELRAQLARQDPVERFSLLYRSMGMPDSIGFHPQVNQSPKHMIRLVTWFSYYSVCR